MKLSSALIITAFTLLTAALVLLSFAGLLRVVVSTSMMPTYNPGDVLLLKPADGVYPAGSIISFTFNNKLVTHRVVAEEGGQLVTQGDGNARPDTWKVSPADVVGEPVLRIPWVGYLLFFIRQPLGWFLVVIVPAGILAVSTARNIVALLKKRSPAGPD